MSTSVSTGRGVVDLAGSHVSTADLTGTDDTQGWLCRKRDGSRVRFDREKIYHALRKCFHSVTDSDLSLDQRDLLAREMVRSVIAVMAAEKRSEFEVEYVQRRVLQQMWGRGFFDFAEHYQNYREEHRKIREAETAPVFIPRKEAKPFQYPAVSAFKEAMHKSPWTFRTYNPVSDVQDFLVYLNPAEKTASTRTILAISQIEVDVKRFWLRLGQRVPKTEFEQVGVAFADSEVRHFDAYSNILNVLGLNDKFSGISQVPAIQSRIAYIKRALQPQANGDKGFAKSLAMFSLLIENVSLFSQFVVMRSFYQQRGIMKNIDNTVQATMKEETVHALFGAWLCNLIKSERPEWFGPAFQDELRSLCLEAYEGERNILDWIFAEGNVSSVSRPALDAFLKDRINQGMRLVGCDPVFPKVGAELAELEWFNQELAIPVHVDFFWKESTDYTSNGVDVSAGSMWD